jgi:hypothetical protein
MVRPEKWICINAECRKTNWLDVSLVEMARKEKKKLLLVCGNCGFVLTLDGSVGSVEKEKDWQDCILYTGSENRLPSGKLSHNMYLDHEGRSYDRNEYICEHGVDPEIYLKWRDRGSPMSGEG